MSGDGDAGWGDTGWWWGGGLHAFTRRCLGSGAYSLTLRDLAVRALGLRALQEISSGMVLVHHNPQLCFLQKVPWGSIFRNPRQRLFQTHNKPPEQCGKQHPWGTGLVVGRSRWTTLPAIAHGAPLQRARGWSASTSAPTGTAGVPVPPSASPASGSCAARSASPPATSWTGERRAPGTAGRVPPPHPLQGVRDPIAAPTPRSLRPAEPSGSTPTGRGACPVTPNANPRTAPRPASDR